MTEITQHADAAWPLPRPDLGSWREGNTGTEGVWRFDSGVPGRELMVSAIVHGNELCGAWAVLAALQAGLRPRRGVLSLAFCNLAAFDLYDVAQPFQSRRVDEDLNRVWGSMDWAAEPALSLERQRALALRPFIERTDWLLDLHSMSSEAPALMLSGLAARHIALARAMGAPALVVSDAGHAEGRRMRDHGRFGQEVDDDSRALLLECGFHGALASRDVALDGMSRFLAASGVVDEADLPPAWRQPLPARQQVLEVTHAVVALTGDAPRFAAAWRTGQRVDGAGTLLGWNGGQIFRTPYAGCTLIMPSLREVRPGMTIVRLARDAEQVDP